jgi:hypothetical protein
MKKKHGVFFGVAVLMIAATFTLAGCDNPVGGDDDHNGGVDWTSHNADYSILVRNNTGKELVVFKGSLQNDNIIGGIPAHTQNHGLSMNTTLFDKTEDFPMIILTKEQYEAHKNNLPSQTNTAFTRVYVFYNKNDDNNAVYEIAAGLGGNNNLIIQSPSTTLNVEIRLGGVAGETIGYAPAGMLETTLKLENGDYTVFPVFKRYNRTRDVVETVYPKTQDGTSPWFDTRTFDGSENLRNQRLDLNSVLRGLTLTSGSAWIIVDNQTASSAIRFYEGSVPRTTPAGYQGISNGTPITFQVDMPTVEGSRNYADSRSISNWSFGVPTRTVDLGPVTIERDKMYTVTVSGDANAGGFSAVIDGGTPINLNEFAF